MIEAGIIGSWSKSNLTMYSLVEAPNFTVYPSRNGSRYFFFNLCEFTNVPCDDPKCMT